MSMAVLFVAIGVILVLLSLVTRSSKMTLFGFIAFIIAGIMWIVATQVAKSQVEAFSAEVMEQQKPRLNIEVYSALVGQPDSCVQVIDAKDGGLIPFGNDLMIGALICPDEIVRKLSDDFKVTKEHTDYIVTPNSQSQPYWFTPHHLGDSAWVAHEKRNDTAKSQRVLYFSLDSAYLYAIGPSNRNRMKEILETDAFKEFVD